MAEILLARVRGPHAFERPVAIKRILSHLAEDRAFVEMFVNEARIAAGIHHARVVQVHELAAFEGEYYLVMEYVEGESLGGLMRRLWLRGEQLDRALAAHIIAEACAGLHAAHELTDANGGGREIVHRDVSPQNVMLTYAGEIKVLDFGIAKAVDSARSQGGQVKGKCEYMSPEQCCGEPLDRRSDIFSLGILLYELTVGKRLFKRDNAMLVFHAVCREPIPWPHETDPAFPRVLESICSRALARDRRERYATMLEMRRDLVAAIRGMAGTAERAGEEERLASVMRRLFHDRIHDKRTMLSRAQAGSTVEGIPVAEADAEVELPDAPRSTNVGSTFAALGSAPGGARTRRRRGVAVAVAAALAAALVGAALWLGGAVTADPPADDLCGVRQDGRLYCTNTSGAPLHAAPSFSSSVANRLQTTRSWFMCWGTGDRHARGTTWYYTLGDDNARWGWIPGANLRTPDGFDGAPTARGLKQCTASDLKADPP